MSLYKSSRSGLAGTLRSTVEFHSIVRIKASMQGHRSGRHSLDFGMHRPNWGSQQSDCDGDADDDDDCPAGDVAPATYDLELY